MTCLSPIQQTQAWLNNFIIHYSICPFAQAVVQENSLHYFLDESTDLAKNLENVILQAQHLDVQEAIETTLLLYPTQFGEFADFLEYVALAEELLLFQGYEGIYQLATFHPDYCFAETEQDDPANYTNRSPYPMLHLLRESSIESALAHFPHPEKIPERNITLLRQLGTAKIQALLAGCGVMPNNV